MEIKTLTKEQVKNLAEQGSNYNKPSAKKWNIVEQHLFTKCIPK